MMATEQRARSDRKCHCHAESDVTGQALLFLVEIHGPCGRPQNSTRSSVLCQSAEPNATELQRHQRWKSDLAEMVRVQSKPATAQRHPVAVEAHCWVGSGRGANFHSPKTSTILQFHVSFTLRLRTLQDDNATTSGTWCGAGFTVWVLLISGCPSLDHPPLDHPPLDHPPTPRGFHNTTPEKPNHAL